MRSVLFLCLTLFTSAVPNAFADCKCPEKPSLNQAVEDASIVFLGRVTSIKNSVMREGKMEIEFAAFNRFKTEFEETSSGRQLLIYTPDGPQNCGVEFLLEQDYLVFGKGNPARYEVDACSRTGLVELVKEDIEALGKKK